eukprot:16236585-Heterocapsa_arctica.AAC.1
MIVSSCRGPAISRRLQRHGCAAGGGGGVGLTRSHRYRRTGAGAGGDVARLPRDRRQRRLLPCRL